MRLRGLATLWLACSMWPASVLSHAVFESSSPAALATLQAPPSEIVLRFNEPVSPVVARLVDSTGTERASAPQDAPAAREIHIPIHTSLDPGRYLVSYRVISDDAHPVAASFAFDVAAPGSTADATSTRNVIPESVSSPKGDAWRRGVLSNRAAFVFALLMAAGGALFLAVVQPVARLADFVRRQIRIAASIALVLAGTSVALSGAQLIGGTSESLYDPNAWLLAVRTTLGFSLLVTVVGLVGLLRATRFEHVPTRTALIALAVCVTAGRALTGHSATTSPVPLMMLAQALHALVAAFWIGSLLPLFRGLSVDLRADAGHMLRRFSNLAIGAVGALVVAGALMAYVLVRTPDALVNSYYGRILIGKLAAVALLLLLAALNKMWLTRGIERGRTSHASAMRATIILEIFLMINVMAATSSLGSSAPPHRAGTIVGATHELSWHVESSGPRQSFHFEIDSPTSANAEPKGAQVQFTRIDDVIEPIIVDATRDTDGTYRADMSAVTLSGDWRVTVEVLVTDFDKERFETSIHLE